MFTVLHKATGFEDLIEAQSVKFEHANAVDNLDRVTIDYPPGRDCDGRILTYGSVFVMNSNGKTVATYHLGYPEVQR
jgi:hypothetical protein